MGRLRFLRIVLPVALLLLLGFVFRDCELRPTVHTPATSGDGSRPRMEDVSIEDLAGASLKQAIDAGLIQEGADGRLILRGIRRLEIARSGRGPLIVSAEEGEGVGPAGRRIWRFDREVTIHDPAADLELRLPQVEIDEAAGLARASGAIRFSGTGVAGEASSVVYGLTGPPRALVDPRIHDAQRRLVAQQAELHDGVRDIELAGEVTAERPGERLTAGRMRLLRSASGALERMTASGSVRGDLSLAAGPPAELAADEMEVRLRGNAIERLRLHGGAALERDGMSLAAPTIEMDRRPDGFTLEAGSPVDVAGLFESAPGLLRAEHLTARFDAGLALEGGEAQGGVRFTAGLTRAEGERATFAAAPGAGTIELTGAERRKARLARDRTRVAADTIRTDPRGERLDASGHVEATLLPAAAGATGGIPSGMFRQGEAVHFVAARLVGEGRSRFAFSGDVRAWQGERNLSAQHVVIEEQARRLSANDQVSTRIPRAGSSPHAAEAEYVQIAADRLQFDDAAHRATYEGDVRLVLGEGWLEAEQMDVDLTADGQIAEVRAAGQVRLEIRPETGAEHAIHGEGDRLRYDPPEQTVRIFGDRAPASVRRTADGATTSGRVLRYRLDVGTLEVESGGQGATIRTAKMP